MTDAPLVDGTTRRTAAVCSLVAVAVAVFWLIQSLRGQVPAPSAHNVHVSVAYFFGVAVFFGVVARRLQSSGGYLFTLMLFPTLSALWAGRFVIQLFGDEPKPHFGVAGIVTFVAALGLVAAGVLLHERQRRRDAQSAVERG
jgi:hypothetical protein